MTARVLAWVLLAQLAGGLAPIFTKLALAGLGPWSVVAGRQLFGALALLFIWRASTRSALPREPLEQRDWVLLLVLAWLGFALPQVLLAFGIDRSTATNGALLSPLEPIGILFGSVLLLGERLTAPRALAMALGAGGATLVVMAGGSGPTGGHLAGDLLIAAGHLAWAIYTLAAKPLVARLDPLRISLWSVALSLPPCAALAATEPFDLARALPALGWLLSAALLSTAIGTYAWNHALQHVSAGTMAAFIFVQPLVGLAAGALALAEPVGVLAIAGAALIVAGVVIAGLRGEAP